MNTFNRKNILFAICLSVGAIASAKANAAETNVIEQSISEILIIQGEKVVMDLSAQLQASISEKVASFSIDYDFEESVSESLAWLAEETVMTNETATMENEPLQIAETKEQ